MNAHLPSLPSLAEAIHADGTNEVDATWVAAHRDEVRLIDVREPHELDGPLGHIEGVESIPLLDLLAQASRLDPKQPLVLVCRSGRRSGEAAARLRQAGVETVASVEGGMIAYNLEVLKKHTIVDDERSLNTNNLADAIHRTNGLPEVSARWVASNIGRFRLVDVREPDELVAHGKVAQAENIPLATFMGGAHALDRAAPLVVMCASGGRSGRVVRALESSGFTAVASLEGGMFGWKAAELPVAMSAAA
ncbi:MAG TPA: rhodanese-like domain-containing protein [Polyangiaceae bacterium]|nr:rhodanese-like domain-containing protein [Polyangiaceae bacterium]